MTVYIDKALKKYIVPTEIRDNSKAEGKIFTPGTRIPLPKEAKFIRLFTAWGTKDEPAGFDIDLSSAFVKVKEDGSYKMEDIAFYNQTSDYAVSSGDQVSCKVYNEGDSSITAEYIDIDIERASKEFDYALTSNIIFSSSHLTFDYETDVNVYSGIIMLNEKRSSIDKEININNSLFKMKLHGDFSTHTAVAIDFKTKEIVIIDKYNKGKKYMTSDKSFTSMDILRKKYFNATDFMGNMHFLLKEYCKANNYKITKNKEEADIICSYNDEDCGENQEMFNVGTNLENILSILSA